MITAGRKQEAEQSVISLLLGIGSVRRHREQTVREGGAVCEREDIKNCLCRGGAVFGRDIKSSLCERGLGRSLYNKGGHGEQSVREKGGHG